MGKQVCGESSAQVAALQPPHPALCLPIAPDGTSLVPTIDALLRSGASPNPPAQLHGLLPTPLHLAARHGFAEAAQKLLDFGANPCASERYGANPMHVACARGHTAVATALAAAAPGVANVDGPRALPLVALAVLAGHRDTAAALIAMGLEVNPRGPGGYALLQRLTLAPPARLGDLRLPRLALVSGLVGLGAHVDCSVLDEECKQAATCVQVDTCVRGEPYLRGGTCARVNTG